MLCSIEQIQAKLFKNTPSHSFPVKYSPVEVFSGSVSHTKSRPQNENWARAGVIRQDVLI